MSVASTVPRLTEEEYLVLERAAPFKSEFFDGEMFAMAGGSAMHSLIAANLIRKSGSLLTAIQTLGKSAAKIGGWRLRKVQAGRRCGPGVTAEAGWWEENATREAEGWPPGVEVVGRFRSQPTWTGG